MLQFYNFLSRVFLYFLDRYAFRIAEDGDAVGAFGFMLSATAAISLAILSEDTEENRVNVFKCYSREVEYNEDNVAEIIAVARDGLASAALALLTR